MTDIISFSKVIDHERLTDRLAALRAAIRAVQADDPGQNASPVLSAAVATLLRDVYRLISREPGDAQLWLDLFRDAHLDHDHETADEWLTLEALDYLAEQRSKKTYPTPEISARTAPIPATTRGADEAPGGETGCMGSPGRMRGCSPPAGR